MILVLIQLDKINLFFFNSCLFLIFTYSQTFRTVKTSFFIFEKIVCFSSMNFFPPKNREIR